MADATKITKIEKSFKADDGQKRGPKAISACVPIPERP